MKTLTSLKALFTRLYHEDDAATAVEYAIIAALVGVALIGALSSFRESIQEMLQDAADSITNN
jgi:pilus assembly protein Flp/PilA